MGVKNNTLAAWELVCRPKRKGGLGVSDLKTQNVELLLKHLYKFYNHHDVPWVTLIWDTNYAGRLPHAVDPIGSFWWRDIMQLSNVFRGITRLRLGTDLQLCFGRMSGLNMIMMHHSPRSSPVPFPFAQTRMSQWELF